MDDKQAAAKIFRVGIAGECDYGDVAEMGFKAFNLARMARIGLPVPPALVLGSGCCHRLASDGGHGAAWLRQLLRDGLPSLEQAAGLGFGASRRPLLVSVRSGAAVSMPGMMDTVLNVGLNEQTLHGLLRMTGNPRLVWDAYRRLIQQFAEVVAGAEAAAFRAPIDDELKRCAIDRVQSLDFDALRRLARTNLQIYREIVGEDFPQDPMEQLTRATAAVFRSWQSARAAEYRRLHGVPDTLGTAATIQQMIFGNAGGMSGSGVGFTRDPATGENRLFVDFLFNSQGEDVVSGRHTASDTDRLIATMPAVWQQIARVASQLEAEFGDMQDFEFTVSHDRLYLLQTRAGKRTPWAALRIAVEQVQAGLLTPEQGLNHLAGIDLERLVRTTLVADDGAAAIATAQSASVGVASGPVAFDVTVARRFAASGKPPILVRNDVDTDDVAGIAIAAGLLTASGGRTAHAAVVARQLDKVCLVGCTDLRLDAAGRSATIGGRNLAEGEIVTLDANEGRVFFGTPRSVVERPDALLAVVASWRLAPAPRGDAETTAGRSSKAKKEKGTGQSPRSKTPTPGRRKKG